MRIFSFLSLVVLCTACAPSIVATETGGYVYVEAEDFKQVDKSTARQWYKIKQGTRLPADLTDSDPNHAASASGGAYLEILPDTRTSHDDELKRGENFSNKPGEVGTISYPIRFTTPGRYYVWVRTFSTNSEDNSVHVGLNGEWPDSGQRLQWCDGRNEWYWESKQRTKEEHCGIEKMIYIDIPAPGIHTISFSMREDGFEFDAFVMEQAYERPKGGA